ncbi:hypothetical protein, partial [Neochlamydia sp. TUME1]|uniref:hypothetical protein n=1 Tax=Neochlamydia sp. TUME1 TaxID=1478174 RepID=UPI001EE75CDE
MVVISLVALFNSSAAELRNFVVFGCFLPYQTPYLSSTGLSRVLVLFNNSAAELRNFVVFGCFLPYQTPLSLEYG